MTRKQITIPADIAHYTFAGNSTFTLVSTKTGTRYTYKLQRADGEDEGRPWFVRVLTGSDNNSDYSYAGFIPGDKQDRIIKGKKGMNPSAPSVVALGWFLNKLANNQDALAQIEFWHEGRCGACGRKLTVPESIDTGLGPDCARRMGVNYGRKAKAEVPEDIAIKSEEQEVERVQDIATYFKQLSE